MDAVEGAVDSSRTRFLWFVVARRYAVVAVFIAGLCACLVSGTMYSVSLFLPRLKQLHHYSQLETNLIGAIGSFGQYLGFISAAISDLLSVRIGMLVSGVLLGLGYAGIAASFYNVSAFFALWPVMAACLFFVGLGSFGVYTAGFTASLHNIDNKHTGMVMGTMVSGFAASSLIYAVVFIFGLRDQVEAYLVLLSASTFGIAMLAAVFVQKLDAGAVVAIEMAPMVNHGNATAVVVEQQASPQQQKRAVSSSAVAEEKSMSPLQAVQTADFWLLGAVLFFVNGPGLLFITIQGSVALSLQTNLGDWLVVVLGVSSVVFRMICGYLSDLFSKRGWATRGWFLLPSAVTMCVAQLAFALIQTPTMMFVAAAMVGAAYGAVYVIVASLTRLTFGLKHMGINNALAALGTAFSVFVLGVLNGVLYSQHAVNNVCVGADCFRLTFFLTTGVTFVGILVSLFLARRVSKAAALSEQQQPKAEIVEFDATADNEVDVSTTQETDFE